VEVQRRHDSLHRFVPGKPRHHEDHKRQRAQAPRRYENETVDRRKPFRLDRHVPVDRSKRDGEYQRHHSPAAQHAHVFRVTIIRGAILRERPPVQQKGEREPHGENDHGAHCEEWKIQVWSFELHYRVFTEFLLVSPRIEIMSTGDDRYKQDCH
jgi:hypothetical protein